MTAATNSNNTSNINKVNDLLQQLRTFKSALPGTTEKVDLATVQSHIEKLFNAGVVIHPNLFAGLTKDEQKTLTDRLIVEFGVTLPKLNATFYKTFKEVKSLNRYELFLHQILHYASTYGNVSWLKNSGEVWLPEVTSEKELADMQLFANTLVIFDIFSKAEELQIAVNNLLSSGLALKSTTVQDLVEIITNHNFDVDLDNIKNKEAYCILALKLDKLPENFDELVRILMYQITGKPLLIKSKDLYQKLAEYHAYFDNMNKIDPKVVENFLNNDGRVLATKTLQKYIDTYGEQKLAENAQRYREFLVLLRKFADNDLKSDINRVLRITKKQYKTVRTPLLNRVFDPVNTSEEDLEFLMLTANVYQLVKLHNAAVVRLNSETKSNVYNIRNGKTMVSITEDKFDNKAIDRAEFIKYLTLKTLQTKLSHLSGKTFVIPNGVDYALPTTAKTSLSGAPDFTTITLNKKAIIGIAWEQNADLDLHTISIGGEHYGWNTRYYDKSAPTYSGDMTALNEHGFAAEYFEFPKDLKSSYVLNVNGYSTRGHGGSVPFKFVVAADTKFETKNSADDDWRGGYNSYTERNAKHSKMKSVFNTFTDIKLIANSELAEREQKSYVLVEPIIEDGKKKAKEIRVTLANVGILNNHRVSTADGSKSVLEIMLNKSNSALKLRELLALLGATVVDNINDVPENVATDDVINLSAETLAEDSFTKFLTV